MRSNTDPARLPRRRWLPHLAIGLVFCGYAHGVENLVFHEPFEDINWASRGWYDGPRMEITDEDKVEGEKSCVWHWQNGATSPDGRGARVALHPVNNVTLSFYMKHSANWQWTGVDWHPHEFHFVTTEDHEYVGPAYTHLTFYIEVVNGVPRVAIQDGANIDQSRIGQNLVNVTEQRSVAGGNGDSDGHGKGNYYLNGANYWNGKDWRPSPRIAYFGAAAGDHYMGDWHHVKTRLQLNTIEDGVGQRDGIVQYWFDGQLLIDHDDVVFRTGHHPDMLINQFLMTPYLGDGARADQKIWIDELMIHTDDGLLPTVDPDLIAKSDFDGSGKVGFPDFLEFVSHFGSRQAQPDFDATFDLNDDGLIDFADFLEFVSVFGRTVDL